MDPVAFDAIARSFTERTPRRRALSIFGAAVAAGLGAPLLRRGIPADGQETIAATPVIATDTDAGTVDPPTEAGLDDLRTCEQWLLTGGPSLDTPIEVDDDLTVYLNDHPIFEDADGTTNIFSQLPFGARNGDQLTVVARDQGSCRKIGALWLHCVTGGEPRFLTGGLDDGCDPDRAAPENFYRESWRI